MKKEFKLEFTLKQKIIYSICTAIAYGLILFIIGKDQSITSICIQSICFGVIFILLYPWVLNKIITKRIDEITPDLLENEKIEDEIFANLFRGIEGVGGKIFLTNNRLIFKSHSLNIQKGQTNIDYSIIHSVSKRKTAKLIDNGIKVATKDGKEYDFVVDERDDVLKKIQDRIPL